MTVSAEVPESSPNIASSSPTETTGALATALVPPDRLSDRLLTSGILSPSNPVDLSITPLVGYIFEVRKPWFPGSQLLSSITKTLTQETSKLQVNETIDQQFEQLLKEVNITLNSVSETGETEWIGSFNGVIVIIAGQEIHFSQTGRCPGYLLQNNRIRQITDESVEAEPHPLKTFAHIASGVIDAGDKILFANQELYSEISLDALRRILTGLSPYSATETLANELKKQKNPGATLLAIQTGALSSLKSEKSLLTTMEAFEPFPRRIWRTSQPARKAALRFSTIVWANFAAASIATYVFSKKLLSSAYIRFFPNQPKKSLSPDPTSIAQSSEISHNDKPVIELILPVGKQLTEAKRPEESSIGSIIPASEFAIEAPLPERQPSVWQQFIREKLTWLFHKLSLLLKTGIPRFIAWIQIQKNQRIAALALAIVLVASVTWGLIGHRASQPNGEASKNNPESQLSTIETLVKQVQSLASSQPTEALTQAATAVSQLNALSNLTDTQKNRQKSLWQDLNTTTDTLTTTSRLTTSTYYSFTEKPAGFASNLPYFYGFADSSTNIVRTGSGELSTVQATVPLGETTDVATAIAHSDDGESAAFILSRLGNVFRLAQIGTTTRVAKISPEEGDFVTGNAIASYSNNLYILDGRGGLLWKYAGTGTSYQKGTMIIDVNKIDLRNTVSFSIDGQIYILKDTGSVVKLSGGKVDTTFIMQGTPAGMPAMIRPLQIITGEGFQSIYILDGGSSTGELSSASVYEYTKNGDFVRRYAFGATVTDVRGFDVNQKQKKLWLVSGKDVLEYEL